MDAAPVNYTETTTSSPTSVEPSSSGFKKILVFIMLMAVFAGIGVVLYFALRPEPPTKCSLDTLWTDCTKAEHLEQIETQCKNARDSQSGKETCKTNCDDYHDAYSDGLSVCDTFSLTSQCSVNYLDECKRCQLDDNNEIKECSVDNLLVTVRDDVTCALNDGAGNKYSLCYDACDILYDLDTTTDANRHAWRQRCSHTASAFTVEGGYNYCQDKEQTTRIDLCKCETIDDLDTCAAREQFEDLVDLYCGGNDSELDFENCDKVCNRYVELYVEESASICETACGNNSRVCCLDVETCNNPYALIGLIDDQC